MRKPFSKRVLRLLKVHQKHQSVDYSESCLFFASLCKNGRKLDLPLHTKEPKNRSSHLAILWRSYSGMHMKLFYDYLDKGQTMNSSKRTIPKKKIVFFHQDNAPYHRWQKYTNYNKNCFRTHHVCQTCVPASFTCWQKMVTGKSFGSSEGVIAETRAYFAGCDNSFYK